jgi:hypothetical protein
VGNGDVHRLHQLGTCYSLVDAERDAAAICDAIAAGRVHVASRPLSWFEAARTVTDLMVMSPMPRGAARSPRPAEA